MTVLRLSIYVSEVDWNETFCIEIIEIKFLVFDMCISVY